MKELVQLLTQFLKCLKLQNQIYQTFPETLDREESCIAEMRFLDLERLLIEKDQIVQRCVTAEKRRLILLQKITNLIGYDARGHTVAANDFLLALQVYRENISNLVDAEVFAELTTVCKQIQEESSQLSADIRQLAPRIKRNKYILKRLQDNFSKSVAIFGIDHKKVTHSVNVKA